MSSKNDIKNIVDTVYEKINLYIDENQNVEESVFIDFLHSIANEILNDKFENPVGLNKLTFEDEYKRIAKESLNSFSDTNNSIDALAVTNESMIEDYNSGVIDSDSIMEKFQEIQDHVHDELNNANKTINNLMSEIHDLEKKSVLDPLTKVYNRRALDDYLSNYEKLPNRNEDMHILILDIDDFKIVNDSYGHVAGDKVLIFLANLLKKILRESDKIFRYGGEEFIVALNRIDNTTCSKIVERIIELVRNNKLSYQSKRINITLSVGATTFKKSDTVTTVITRADQALYEAKSLGKNQACYKV